MSAIEPVERVAIVLANTARVIEIHKDIVRTDRRLNQIASALSGLIDVRTGLHVTSPEDTAAQHMALIDKLMGDG